MPYLLGQLAAGEYTLGDANYTHVNLAIVSAPSTLRRGSSYTISMVGAGLVLADISATVGGQAISVVSTDGSTVGIMIPDGLNAKHTLIGLPLTVTVAGVGSVTTSIIPFLPPVGWDFIDQVDPINDADSIGLNMLNELGQASTLATGDQVVHQELSSPGHAGSGLPVNVTAQGRYGINVSAQSVAPQTFSAYVIQANGVVGQIAVKTITYQDGADIIPADYTLTAVTGAPREQWVESNVVTVTDVDAGLDIAATVTGGLEHRVSTNSGSTWGAYTTAAQDVQLNYQIQYRIFTSNEYSDPVTGTATIGGVVRTFTATTVPLAAVTYAFTSLTDVARSTEYQATSAVTGFTESDRLEFSNCEISINNGSSYSSSSPAFGVVGQTIARVTLTSSDDYNDPESITATINGVDRTFTATTLDSPALSLTMSAALQIGVGGSGPDNYVTVVGALLILTFNNFSARPVTYQRQDGASWVDIGTASSTPYQFLFSLTGYTEGESVVFRAYVMDGEDQVFSSSHTVVVRQPPVVTLATAAGVKTGAFEVTATFSKSVSFTGSPVFAASVGSISEVTGSGTSYTLTVIPPANANGSLILTLTGWSLVVDAYGITADPYAGVGILAVTYNTSASDPQWMPTRPIRYFNSLGVLQPLSSVADIPYAIFGPGGLRTGQRLLDGVMSTDVNGLLPPIKNAALGAVGDPIFIVLTPPGRSIVISAVVSDGGAG